jgi:hypothetical protein
MKTINLRPLLIPGLLIAYNFLFWDQSFGINLPIFFLLLSLILFSLFPHIRSGRLPAILISGSLIASVLVVLNNTSLSKGTAIIMVFISIAFVHHASLRSGPYGLLYFAIQLIRSPKTLWKEFRKLTAHSPGTEKIFRHHKLIYFPVLITIVFLIIYSIGDPQFASSLGDAVKYLGDFLEWLSEFLSVSHLVFLLFGLLLLIAATVPKNPSAIVEGELKQSDLLIRKRRREGPVKKETAIPSNVYIPGTVSILPRPVLTLKNEYRRGLITLILINLLLLCVNSIDISKVWFEGQHDVLETTNWRSNATMRSQAVHASTDALILSIFLAMAVLLFFFRGNINFLRKNKLIQQLAYVWIIQNVLLGATVALRNYYYIDDCGLTMKRIGVFAFLLATSIGLLMFYFKIRDKKSTFYLIRINSWAVAGIFLLLSLVDWDPLMARYNINHLPPDKLDKQFLLWLSDHALPVLIEHKEIFLRDQESKKNSWKEGELQRRVEHFMDRYESRSWASWNYADYRVHQYLITQEKITWNRQLESSTN